MHSTSHKIIFAAALLAVAASAPAMDITLQPGPASTTLTAQGANFRYTWDTRRGGELASVEQPGTLVGGWWNKGNAKVPTSAWQRVNSTFAWHSLDTIPSLSFSTKRGAYYSGEWNIAYANADRHATLKIIKQSPEELVFETHSNPHILENLHLPIPWQVKQTVRVFDSGVILTHLEISLPKDETYELDWASISVNLDDSLYKEPHPDRQWRFAFSWAFPGENEILSGFYKSVLQDLPHLPLDIDLDIAKTIMTEKPILFGAASYDLTHIKGAAPNGFAEWCLQDAKSLVDTKEDFGCYLLIRPRSGMSLVPTDVGSMRGNPCMSAGWNLFDGKTRGLNEPLTYRNTLTFATGTRKHSSLPNAAADDRNILLGARIYDAKDKLPTAADIQAMAADDCDTLILGPSWRADENAATALVKVAHAAGIRVAATVSARDFKSLVTDTAWFTRIFEKDRDGIYVSNASFLANAPPPEDFTLDGETISFITDGPFRANAASFALCMRKLRQIVGPRGFLIGEDAAPGPTLLSFAECDLHASAQYISNGTPQDRTLARNRAAAGYAPILASLTPQQLALTAMHADTPIILWPPKDKQYLTWWQLARTLPAKGFHIESDLLPAERAGGGFTTSSPDVHGTLFGSGDGHLILLLAAEKPASAVTITLTLSGAAVTTSDNKPIPLTSNTFSAGDFAASQVKSFTLTAPKEPTK